MTTPTHICDTTDTLAFATCMNLTHGLLFLSTVVGQMLLACGILAGACYGREKKPKDAKAAVLRSYAYAALLTLGAKSSYVGGAFERG